MTIHEKLKTDLTQAIVLYSRKFNVSNKLAKEMSDLLKIISVSFSAVQLSRNIKNFLPKMHGIILIIDFNQLRKRLSNILDIPKYSLASLLFIENAEMRNEIRLLQIKMTTPKVDSDSLKTLTDRLSALESHLSSMQEKNVRLTTENKFLCAELTTLQKDKASLEQEKQKLENSLEELHSEYLEKVEECRVLQEELKKFESPKGLENSFSKN